MRKRLPELAIRSARVSAACADGEHETMGPRKKVGGGLRLPLVAKGCTFPALRCCLPNPTSS